MVKSRGGEHRGKAGTMILVGTVERGERKANRCRSVETCLGDVRTGGWHFLRDQLGDALILPEPHPACRRREARQGFGTERENLAGDGKGKDASGPTTRARLLRRR
jgi:hypothetical protein